MDRDRARSYVSEVGAGEGRGCEVSAGVLELGFGGVEEVTINHGRQ